MTNQFCTLGILRDLLTLIYYLVMVNFVSVYLPQSVITVILLIVIFWGEEREGDNIIQMIIITNSSSHVMHLNESDLGFGQSEFTLTV